MTSREVGILNLILRKVAKIAPNLLTENEIEDDQLDIDIAKADLQLEIQEVGKKR